MLLRRTGTAYDVATTCTVVCRWWCNIWSPLIAQRNEECKVLLHSIVLHCTVQYPDAYALPSTMGRTIYSISSIGSTVDSSEIRDNYSSSYYTKIEPPTAVRRRLSQFQDLQFSSHAGAHGLKRRNLFELPLVAEDETCISRVMHLSLIVVVEVVSISLHLQLRRSCRGLSPGEGCAISCSHHLRSLPIGSHHT